MLKESCPIEVFATELRRRIQEGSGDAQKNLQTLPCLTPKEEALIAEKLAHGNVIYKVNNLMTSKTLLSLFERLNLHNSIFPQTSYQLTGFTGFGNGSIYPILQQDFIIYEREATPIEIDMYMSAIGFQKLSAAKFSNGVIEVSDLHPRNVLKDYEGDLYVIDAEFRLV
ncbi:MAG: hypothetical protein J5524_08970 [Bacteroidaceae bacterium]|nr:hypothetical protein [Bacteroidaceae bacterium]MBO4841214.1 hypothetical protein [Bacteroidaceae bacterium]